MARRLAWAGVTVVVMVAGACNRQDEPPPPFNAVLVHGSLELPPIPLVRPDVEGLRPVSSARLMKKISGTAGAAAEGGAEAGGGKAAEAAAVALNDSDPQALMQQYVELSKAGNLDAVATMYITEQQAFFKKVGAAAKAFEAAAKRLNTALESSDAELAKQFVPNEAGSLVLKKPDGTDWPPIVLRPVLELVGVEAQGDDRATATLKHGQTEKKLELQKAEEKWRIRDPQVPSAAEEANQALAGVEALAKGITEVADKVEKNELQAADVLKEIPAAVQKAAQSAPPAEPKQGEQPAASDVSEKPAEKANDASKKAAKPGPRRTRSGRDVDNEAPTVEESLGRQ